MNGMQSTCHLFAVSILFSDIPVIFIIKIYLFCAFIVRVANSGGGVCRPHEGLHRDLITVVCRRKRKDWALLVEQIQYLFSSLIFTYSKRQNLKLKIDNFKLSREYYNVCIHNRDTWEKNTNLFSTNEIFFIEKKNYKISLSYYTETRSL